MNQVSAYVLAGGKSSRMQQDKALLPLRGRTLLEYALDLARAITPHIRIVGPKAKFGDSAIEDVYADRGPLGGIHAALTHTGTEFNLVMSVDTPFLSVDFVRFLVTEALRCGMTVTVPHVEGRFQPLCAVYQKSFVALADLALQQRQNKIDPLFCHTTVRRIDEEELKRLAFDIRMFDNLNTPEDFARAQKRK